MKICIVSVSREALGAIPSVGAIRLYTGHPGVWQTQLAPDGRMDVSLMERIGAIIGTGGLALARGCDADGCDSVAFWDGRYLHTLPMHFFEEDDPNWYREPDDEELFTDWLLDVKIDMMMERYQKDFAICVSCAEIDTVYAGDETDAFTDWFTCDYPWKKRELNALRQEFAEEWAEDQAMCATLPVEPEQRAAFEVWGRNWRAIARLDAEGLAEYLLHGESALTTDAAQ